MGGTTRARELTSVRKTREWLEGRGYTVELAERSRTVRRRAPDGSIRAIPIRSDLWGADLVARNAGELLWIQVKSNRGDVSRGLRGLEKGPWPSCTCVRRIVVWWPPRRRKTLGPEIWETHNDGA